MGRGDYNRAKTHCPQGHEYTKENTYTNPQGRRWCRICARANGRRQNVKKYGITEERLFEIIVAQDWRCAICGKGFGYLNGNDKRTQFIDHDHSHCSGDRSCGKCVRGVLCDSCNRLLGCAEDSIETLNRAVKYLQNNLYNKENE